MILAYVMSYICFRKKTRGVFRAHLHAHDLTKIGFIRLKPSACPVVCIFSIFWLATPWLHMTTANRPPASSKAKRPPWEHDGIKGSWPLLWCKISTSFYSNLEILHLRVFTFCSTGSTQKNKQISLTYQASKKRICGLIEVRHILKPPARPCLLFLLKNQGRSKHISYKYKGGKLGPNKKAGLFRSEFDNIQSWNSLKFNIFWICSGGCYDSCWWTKTNSWRGNYIDEWFTNSFFWWRWVHDNVMSKYRYFI